MAPGEPVWGGEGRSQEGPLSLSPPPGRKPSHRTSGKVAPPPKSPATAGRRKTDHFLMPEGPQPQPKVKEVDEGTLQSSWQVCGSQTFFHLYFFPTFHPLTRFPDRFQLSPSTQLCSPDKVGHHFLNKPTCQDPIPAALLRLLGSPRRGGGKGFGEGGISLATGWAPEQRVGRKLE